MYSAHNDISKTASSVNGKLRICDPNVNINPPEKSKFYIERHFNTGATTGSKLLVFPEAGKGLFSSVIFVIVSAKLLYIFNDDQVTDRSFYPLESVSPILVNRMS